MYVAPMGRPISSPPSDTPIHVFTPEERRQRRHRLTPEEKAGILADYKSGMKISDIRAKYGYKGHGSIVRLTKPIHNRNTPAKPPRPVREDGESKQRYAARVQTWMRETDPEYDKQIRRNKRKAQRRYHERRRATAEPTATVEVAMPPSPPTFWQRYFGWLWS